MAEDVLTTSKTFDVQIDSPKAAEIVIGSPMDNGGIIAITENGKHVVSDYDIAEVDVQPLPPHTKEITITENGTTEVTPDEGRLLDKVVVKTDTTKANLTEFINNGGTLAAYKGTEMPDIDWDKVMITDWKYFFINAKNVSLKDVNFSTAVILNSFCLETTIIDTELDLNIPNATSISYAFNYVYGNLKKLTIDAPNLIKTNNQFNYCNTIEELSLLNTTKMKLLNYSFTNCNNLRKLSAIECESLIEFPGVFNGNQPALEDFGGFINIGKGVPVNSVFTLSIKNAPKLTHQSLLNVLNALYDLTQLRRSNPLVLQLGEANYNKLTEDEIKIATDKGWTVTQ